LERAAGAAAAPTKGRSAIQVRARPRASHRPSRLDGRDASESGSERSQLAACAQTRTRHDTRARSSGPDRTSLTSSLLPLAPTHRPGSSSPSTRLSRASQPAAAAAAPRSSVAARAWSGCAART
jgi:hypothetical protein